MSFVDQSVETKVKRQPKLPKTKEISEGSNDKNYDKIVLNFGKYSGKMLKDLATEDPKYLKWLKQRFEKDENITPTMKAICKFADGI